MPSTINGIGTWYWGKQNIITRNDTCEFCGSYRQLSSYDTTLYFVVVFIPLIPLGRKRILDDCTGCRKHRALSLGKWEKQKTEALMAAIGEWQSDRSNPDKAATALGVTIGFQDRQAFEDVAPAVAQAFPRDAKVQGFLADAYEHFGQLEAAENAYEAAAELSKEPAARRELARFYIRQLRPDEAKPLLADILLARDVNNTGVLIALAQAYQGVGNHEAAGELLDQMGTAFPNLLSDPDYERVRKVSSKYRGTNKRISVAGLGPKERSGARDATWLQRNGAKAIIATILIIATVWYVGLAASLSSHQVHVVNGTNAPYVVDIDGQAKTVPAKGTVALNLKEGSHTVSVKDHPEIEQTSFELKTPFWKRPLDRRVFVINPDRMAVLYEETVTYSDNPSSDDESDAANYLAGHLLYNLKSAQDVFVQPPSSVRLSSKGAKAKRRHVDIVSKVPSTDMPSMLEERFDVDTANNWLKRAALSGGDDLVTLALLNQRLTPDQMISFLRPRLGDRPVRVEWHRSYQNVMMAHHPEQDLSPEYAALLASNPTDGTLLYLAGRVQQDRKSSLELFAKAAQAQPPSAYALYAMAYDDMNRGNFSDALPRVQKARQLDATNIGFISMELEALEANGSFDHAIELLNAQRRHEGNDHRQVAEELRLLVRKGDPAAAQERIEQYCAELEKLESSKEFVMVIRNWLNASYAYARGDMPAYVSALKEPQSPVGAWQTAIVLGKYADAEDALKQIKVPQAEQYLALAALAGASDAAVADRAWAKASELMQSRRRDDRLFIAEIKSASAAGPSKEALEEWTTTLSERCAMMTCLGVRFPQQRERFFAEAEKLNFSTAFPHVQLAKVLGQPTAGAARP